MARYDCQGLNVGIPAKVDFEKLGFAMNFYQSKGYKEIDVPWLIGEEAYLTTSSPYPKIQSKLGYHVASAEQGFLQMILEDDLEPGKYVACSPCHRDDLEDEHHNKAFMKVELIDYPGRRRLNHKHKIVRTCGVLRDAKEFFEKYAPTTGNSTKEGVDIMLDGVEIGSYGYREHDDFSWVYGTGLAEPRFSYLLSKKPKGYHEADIPRSEFGSEEKIYEEMMEYKDARQQGNKLMALHELSDIIGAVEGHLEKDYFGFNLDDLLKMKEATKRAFENGQR